MNKRENYNYKFGWKLQKIFRNLGKLDAGQTWKSQGGSNESVLFPFLRYSEQTSDQVSIA